MSRPGPGRRDRGTRTVVVGVDGSAGGRAALRWAAHEADRHGDRLEVITVWHGAITTYAPLPWSVVDCEPTARATLSAEVGAVLGDYPILDVHRVIAEGPVGPALIRRAERARLLVVGTRGHRWLGRILSGSMSHFCATHAPCPVVVVPEHGDPMLHVPGSGRSAAVALHAG